ncbi:MAG: hypothetical protein V4735_05985 [Pseudomonadota bacterium]
MSRPLLTIRQRLFRIHLVIALVAVLFVSAGIAIADWSITRRALIHDFENSLAAAARGSATYLQLKDMKSLAIHLSDFYALPGLNTLCVYDAQNRQVSAWQAEGASTQCPSFIMHEGLEIQWLQVATAMRLMRGDTYVGVLYADSELVLFRRILVRNVGVLLSLLLVAYLACRASSIAGGRAITLSLKALQEQVECLTNNDFSVCTVVPPMTTVETAGLAASITAFRTHLAIDTLPRAELKQTRNWYCQIVSGLLMTLRQRLDAQSPLIDTVEHYELLLQMEWGNALPSPVVFDIARLLKASVAAARAEMPRNDQVHVSVSLQSSIQHEWLGHPDIIRSLLKHLLLIALRRTRVGAVCLRLEVDAEPGFAQQHMLRLKLEDSGPPLQRWQLRQWLDQVKDDVPTINLNQDFSWVLTGRLFHYVGGGATAQTEPAGGLTLMGWVPLLKPHDAVAPVASKARAVTTHHTLPPLVMAVEEQAEKRRETRAHLEQAGCRVFMLETHAQALEWAPALPFSAILLNGFLADTRTIVARRLRTLADEGLMPSIPLWAMVAQASVPEQTAWQEAGVSALVSVPMQQDRLQALCRQLHAPTPGFYQVYDAHLHGDFPSSVIMRLSELNREMASQVAQVETIMARMARGEMPVGASEDIHAVKSASLTLGYFRLSALMTEIERAITVDGFAQEPKHWEIIAQSLQLAGFGQP